MSNENNPQLEYAVYIGEEIQLRYTSIIVTYMGKIYKHTKYRSFCRIHSDDSLEYEFWRKKILYRHVMSHVKYFVSLEHPTATFRGLRNNNLVTI